MSPIFNQAALQRLSTPALSALKRAFVDALVDPRLTELDREQLRASLATIALTLRDRIRPAPFKPIF